MSNISFFVIYCVSRMILFSQILCLVVGFEGFPSDIIASLVKRQMVRAIEKSGERAGTETKSAILSGLALAGRLDEAFALYDEIKKEGVLPRAYAVGTLVVGTFFCSDKYTSKLSQDSFMQLSLCNLIQHQ